MRPVLACLITLSLIGGVYGYLQFADGVRRPPIEINIDYSEDEFSVLIESTFECIGDPILETDALQVMFAGSTVFSRKDAVDTSETIEISPLEGVEIGENEIYVSATMSESTSGLGVLKITILRNAIPIFEKMISSQPGLLEVGGPVAFHVKPGAKSETEHEHH